MIIQDWYTHIYPILCSHSHFDIMNELHNVTWYGKAADSHSYCQACYCSCSVSCIPHSQQEHSLQTKPWNNHLLHNVVSDMIDVVRDFMQWVVVRNKMAEGRYVLLKWYYINALKCTIYINDNQVVISNGTLSGLSKSIIISNSQVNMEILHLPMSSTIMQPTRQTRPLIRLLSMLNGAAYQPINPNYIPAQFCSAALSSPAAKAGSPAAKARCPQTNEPISCKHLLRLRVRYQGELWDVWWLASRGLWDIKQSALLLR